MLEVLGMEKKRHPFYVHWELLNLYRVNRCRRDPEPTEIQAFLQKLDNPGVAVAMCLLVFSGFLVVASVAGEGSYDWKTARELYLGIRYAHVEPSVPQKMVVYCLKIDSHTPGLMFYTTPRHAEWVEGKTETNRQTTRNFIRQSRQKHPKLAVAVNANSFSPWPAPFQQEDPTNIFGLAVSKGTLVSSSNTMPSLLVSKIGKLQIATVPADGDLSDVETAVSGFGLCLIDGEVPTTGEDQHPRTGLGLSQDGRYLFLLTIDGRQPSTPGATVQDVGNLLKKFGAHTGINMDGGGSTTMAWWDPNTEGEDKCRLLNTPVGNGESYDPRKATAPFAPTERATGNNLGVYFLETSIK
ncbi:MAG: phosphodiester glycosidase family protein [Candidatus Poribacteria bacterium]